MLVLTRKNRESIVIARPEDLEVVLEITILEIEGGRVRLGFQADTKLPIHRREVWDRICNGESTNGEAGGAPRPGNGQSAVPRGSAERNGSHDRIFEAAAARDTTPPLQAAARQASLKAAASRATTTVDGG